MRLPLLRSVRPPVLGKLSRFSLAVGFVVLAAPSAVAIEPPLEKLPGRIYLDVPTPGAAPRPTRLGLHRVVEIRGIDPNSGQFIRVTPNGSVPRVAPDGQALAYLSDEMQPDGTSIDMLAVRPLTERALARILVDAARLGGWSADGRRLAVRRHDWRAATLRIESGWIEAATGRFERIPIPEHDIIADVSPTAPQLLVAQGGPGMDGMLYVVGFDGRSRTNLARSAFRGRFSPDGQRVAFVRFEEPFGAFVVELNSLKEHRILAHDERAFPGELCWSPDGNHVAIRVARGRIESDHLSIVRADGTLVRTFDLGVSGGDGQPDWK